MLMPIRDVEFLQMPASLSSGEYPLLTSASQSLAGFTKATKSCRVVDDLRQKIKVPTFSGWADCNMIRMGGNLYWILEANTSTDSEASVEMIVSYCGPSSVLHKSDTVVGTFERLPTNACPWLGRAAISSSLEHTATTVLPSIGTLSSTERVFWIQVTMTVGTTEPEYVQKGCFVAVKSNGDGSTRVGWYDTDTSTAYYYPSLDEIMSDPAESFLTTASSILDISISARCPYEFVSGTYSGVTCYTLTKSGTKVPPTDPTATSVGNTYVYNFKTLATVGKYPDAKIYSFYWKPSTDVELSSGTFTIRDEDTSNIGEIPKQLIAMSGETSGITVEVQCISDKQALITYVTYGGYTCGIQEGHLPYLGTQWDEYRAYSLAYDRQSMEQSIDFSNQRVAVGIAQNAANTIQSAAMGFIGGDPVGAAAGAIGGVASFAISTWATQEESRISEAETRATQALAERRVQGQPCTAYNSGYGLIYAIRCIRTPAAIWVEMPAGLTESIDADYTACYGYPAEGLRSITVQEGYIKGRIYESTLARGPRFDRMNEALQNGILFKEV